MKKIYLIIAGLSLMISALANNALVLELNDNTIIKYLTENLPVVTRQEDNVVVTYEGESTEYHVGDVHKFYFGEASLSFVENQKVGSTGELLVFVTDSNIDVYGADGIISLFDIYGRCIKQSKFVEGFVYFDKPSSGVYVLNANGKSVKIIVR